MSIDRRLEVKEFLKQSAFGNEVMDQMLGLCYWKVYTDIMNSPGCGFCMRRKIHPSSLHKIFNEGIDIGSSSLNHPKRRMLDMGYRWPVHFSKSL
ncbi:hypothetical protein C5167_016981 [Papaver somniferum]|uniref:Uncharacterized protein n=1 Tax=Papaver somniferum TaxID=3469 RepID=A0A4Y7II34_PAPSO|nr:hypothetical protein C5167_016981 [Papaver somniferum]